MQLPLRLYAGYAALALISLLAGIGSGHYWVAGLPLLLLVVGLAILNFRPLFWLLLISIPLGAEVFLPGGLSTDLPTEPIAVGLSAVFLLHLARHWAEYDHRTFLHPIALLLYLHVGWIFLSSIFAEDPLVSVKFLLAKLWYVGAFFMLPLLLLRTPKTVYVFAQCIFWPLLFVAVQALVRHAGYGFTFADQFRTLHPFMRNHVAYAGCLATFTPWLGYLVFRRRLTAQPWRWMVLGLVPLWLMAIFFSYTRAAYVSLGLIVVAYYIIRYNWLRPATVLAFVMAVTVSVYLVQDDRYLDYAPEFTSTVSHREFDNLISATYKLEDISTMERFYRWVAAGNMIPYRPVTGFGPGNFVGNYEGYTNNNFETYVSDNAERSGIHNYFLMTLVEQGYPGLFVLLLFMGSILFFGQRLYLLQSDPEAKAAMMAALLAVIVVGAFSVLNDLLETDKVGSLFFISTAILINMGHYRSPIQEIVGPPVK
ncbi:O-antigen ligase [Neolewinella xylanilytica]|uniref:O-antigen ligase n=1 Tax=Neolewinella xylanilytica TaxID=1514080 RepID=A0A2S6I2Y7_9BACT|nr:O-antigen ligase family protein [Neolewinella xylanilytica]PPK85537.1 O-antigen ligase [Neolewinella xylanilytica]